MKKNLFMLCALGLTTFGSAWASEPVAISPASGTDLAAALNEAKAGVAEVGDITINLASGGQYTVSASLEIPAGLTISGAGATVDASGLEAPFILVSETPTATAPEGTDYLRIASVKIDKVNLTGVKNSIFYDNNQKVCVVDFAITNSNIALATTAVQNEALVSFKGGGAKDFTMTNNTVWCASDPVAKYFIRYNNSARLDRYGFDKNSEFQTMNYQNNTFYNVIKADGQWGNYGGIAGQAYSKFDVQKNIWFNCGNEVIRRMAGGRFGSNAPLTFAYNTYFFNGEDNSAKEAQYDKSETILVTNPGFADAAAGNFTLGASTQQAKYQTGASKWFVEFVAPDVTEAKDALLVEINTAKAVLREGDTSEEGVALQAAIDHAQSVYDTAEFNEVILAEIEVLQAAVAEYNKQSGVGQVEATEKAEYFNLQGVRVENPAPGLYICRQGNKTSKVIIK